MTPRIAIKLLLLALPATVSAQAPSSTSGTWSGGIGTAIIASPYAGEGTRIRPIPLLGYHGERVFLQGTSAGVHLHQSRSFTLDAIVSARLSGFDIHDLGRNALAANGIDARLLSDRDDGLDAGLRASFGATWGSLSLEAVGDISDASGGHEISLDYRYSWLVERSVLTANVGVSRMSSELAGYYYGILDEEIARGVAAYSPGAAVTTHLGLSMIHAIGATKWQLVAAVDYQFLPSRIRRSPLLEPDREHGGRDRNHGIGRLVLGLNRRF